MVVPLVPVVVHCAKPYVILFRAIYFYLLFVVSATVPLRFTPGWHSGDVGVCLWAVHGATELRVFTVVAFCAAWNGGGVL